MAQLTVGGWFRSKSAPTLNSCRYPSSAFCPDLPQPTLGDIRSLDLAAPKLLVVTDLNSVKMGASNRAGGPLENTAQPGRSIA